jgi:ATP-binding cassette, subfamily G (WHITE), member 2, PDR
MASAGVFGAVPEAITVVKKAEEAIGGEGHNHAYHNSDPPSPESSAYNEKRRISLAGGEFDSDEEARQQEVTKLARTFTGLSETHSRDGSINPFLGDIKDPELDPFSGKFVVRKWVEHLLGITSRDPDRYPSRTAGVSFRNLNVHGFGSPTDYQKTFGNYPLELASIYNKLRGQKQTKIQILRNFDGLVKSGEMLVVLGRPGSGCSTLLKTISGETHGFYIDKESEINYQGIPMETMHKDFRGECIYQAEVDVHFPQLTVGQTLKFAAEARAPRNRLPGVSREQYAEHMRDVIMAVFGLTHTVNTKVGNDFVRGVSGGERKRVSIAEAALGRSPLQCWDNSTRGLDSATALEFVKTLKISTSLSGATACVAIYQASQAIYDIFDKVVVLYEGRQIYFGNAIRAKQFFIDMGFDYPARATTADFLTSLTSPSERRARPGFEGRVPRTPDEFAARWKDSEDRAQLLRDIDAFEKKHPLGQESIDKFQHSRHAEQAKHQRARSPYTISIPMQVKLCMNRGFQRLQGDMSLFLSGLIGNTIMAMIIGSVFYNLPDNTASFYSRGALLFFAILLNAFSSALEILTMYAQRPIVEKQSKYAFYHPASEGIASLICDLPNKVLTSIFFNLTLYFLTNLRRTPAAFFTFYLFSFTCVLAMSSIFRMIGAFSKSLAQAMAPAAVLILALVIYTGFAIPTRDMHPWFRWLNYLDPVAYAFEALMINEFHGRDFPCSSFVPTGPGYADVTPEQQICSVTGAVANVAYVNGDAYIGTTFQYSRSHLWRNWGILVAMAIFGTGCYLYAAETIQAAKSKGEVLLFRRGQVPAFEKRDDEEAMAEDRVTTGVIASDGGELRRHETQVPATIQKQTAVFHWDGVCYDIKIKKEPRRLLNEVDGWVKPGTLTALMGASGAGKTTLLDVLASRTTMGVISGQMLVDGRLRNSGFQRKTGYVQQQDLHLSTSTVREALVFSALLRQPTDTPKHEKLEYVEEVIKLLEMESYADAVVGVPGEGLNVEQRKRLTIAVEMAAKPALLLFLDEPTSGLDSQTAWSILMLLKKLAANGQAILCTIHQPSALLFQEFDRLLFLASGGRTVYYGDIGESSKILTSYFERNGSRTCGSSENPAEWMLDVIGAAPGSQNTIDWPTIWYDSPERQEIKRQLAKLKEELSDKPEDNDPKSLREYAAPFGQQLAAVTTRVFEQYWRTPSYLYSKVVLCAASGLFIGFSFWMAPTSLQGLQNQLFAIFMLMTIFGEFLDTRMKCEY